MEALAQNITGTCPQAFAGGFGALFAQTIAAMVIAHCGIVGKEWPKDRAAEVMTDNNQASYDFIIAGAGTAGSLLASRLSASLPEKTVLLIEAGDDPGLHSEVPMLLFLNNDISWSYKTEPDDNSCQAFRNKSCIWSKGRAMGGSSSINAMLYIRGHPHDFDHWMDLGNEDWGYEDVLPYFDEIEAQFNITDGGVDRDDASVLYNFYSKAWDEIGYNTVSDKNALTGTRIAKLLVENGQRKNTAKDTLREANERKNLIVIKNTIVHKVLIDAKLKRAVGVVVLHSSGKEFEIKAKTEVILSAGSVATPQILMRSGIGPKKHLQEKNINTIMDLPVGQNLQDHVLLPLLFQIDSTFSKSLTQKDITTFIVQYVLSKTGPFSSVGISDFMAFASLKNDSDYPNLQFHHTFFPKGDQLLLKSYFTDLGYTDNVVRAIETINKENNLLGVYPTLLHPKSRGEILLRDTNLESQPIIKPNYFKDEEDITQLLQGVRLAQKLLATNTFKTLNVTTPKLDMKYCDHKIFNTDDYWKCYIKHIATTIYHPVGTAKMGPDTDVTAVVDKDLKVKGLKNLRVVDASIMPKLVGGNTMAATLMIAEKAAGIVKNQYFQKDEL